MSAPVGRETPQRRVAQHRRGIDSLAKRPAPPVSEGVCEWYRAESTTNLGTSYTDIDWGSANNNGHDSAAATPTFAINGSSNLVIAKSGVYSIEIGLQSITTPADVNTVLFNDLRRIAGARPISFRSTTGGPSILAVPVVPWGIDVTPDIDQTLDPYINTHFALLPTAIDINGACEIRYQAYIEEDQVGTAHSEPTFYVFIARHGEAYEA